MGMMQMASDKVSHAAFMLANKAGIDTSSIYVDQGAQVVPGIFIGSLATAMNPTILQKNSIDAIVNLSGTEYMSTRPMVTITMGDQEVTPANIHTYIQQFTDGAACVRSYRANGKRVLVHCAAGVNRSATLIGFYLLSEGYTYDEVIGALMRANSTRRTQLLTNESFRQLLRAIYSTRTHCVRQRLPETSY